MATTFAEKILESITDENGYCGERGLSVKQFNILVRYLEECESEDCGSQLNVCGKSVSVWTQEFVGQIGRFNVCLFAVKSYGMSYGVKSIEPTADIEEWNEKIRQEEIEKARKKAIRSQSDWVGAIKERLEFDCKVLEVGEFDGRYGHGYRYEFVDNDGNVFVWFTNVEKDIESGDEIRIRATIKDYSEWQGCKQNLVNRVNVL